MDLCLAMLKAVSIRCTMFQHRINAERYRVAQLCVNTLPATKVTLITNGILPFAGPIKIPTAWAGRLHFFQPSATD
jgi:hypothetical protein